MFPVTITLKSADELNAVMAALGNAPVATATKTTKTEAVVEKKSVEKSPPPAETKAAVTESAATVTTAATNDAPATKVDNSAPALLDKDALTTATKAAIAKVGRDEVVALIASYGAAKGSEISLHQRAEFDAKLLKLAA